MAKPTKQIWQVRTNEVLLLIMVEKQSIWCNAGLLKIPILRSIPERGYSLHLFPHMHIQTNPFKDGGESKISCFFSDLSLEARMVEIKP